MRGRGGADAGFFAGSSSLPKIASLIELKIPMRRPFRLRRVNGGRARTVPPGSPARYVAPMLDLVLSLVALGAVALVLGAIALWRKGAPRKQVALMLALALIALVNIAIWTVPDEDGAAPVDRIDAELAD